MAISHNLSVINNNLSGFDPVAGISDGTTVGKSWVLWKLFEGLAAFDSNIKKITNSAPTPAFLQSEVGSNLQTEPALNRAVQGDSIRFYMANDPGLSQSPASAIIYEFKITSIAYSSLCTVRVRHKIENQTTYAPGADNNIISGSSGSITNCLVHLFDSTTTIMNNVPKIIFWKSLNANMIMSIDKATGNYKGYLIWYNPAISGYRNNIGSITNGLNSRITIFSNAANGTAFIEPFTQTEEENISSLVSGLSPLNSAGSMPSSLFTFNSINNLIAGKLRFGVKNNTQFKVITDEIEGIILANTTAANLAAGQIYSYNSKYYLHANTISDGRESHKILLELGSA